MRLELRPYQAASVQAIYDAFAQGKRAPVINIPTGGGKSLIIASFIERALSEFPDTHILCLAHVKELVSQNAQELAGLWPLAPIGVYSAGLRMRQLRQVTFASIQSVYNKPHFYGRFDIIIIDECHVVPKGSSGIYRKLIDGCLEKNPHTKLVGLSASPYRLDSGVVYEGEDALFDCLAYDANVADLISDGYLSRLHARHGDDIDTKGIKITAGDFNAAQLGERLSAKDLVEQHADEIAMRCKDRKCWLVFCVTVEHAQLVSAALQRRGIAAETVSGDMSIDDRDAAINRLRTGETRCICNVNVLTTGFNVKHVDAVVMLRPTKSPGLYIQMVGRGLRLADGKTDCLVLDYGGNVKRHGFIDKVEPPRKRGKGGPQEAPVKACPMCRTLVPIMTRKCPGVHDDDTACTYEFEIAPRESETVAHTGAILSTEVPPVELPVEKIFFAKHVGKSGKPTLRCDYYSGMQRVSEYVCIEHDGYARTKAAKWWGRRTPYPMPESVDEAVEAGPYLAKPRKLLVSFASKYPEILRAEF